ncbi:MAG: maltooligosyltrehalose trehalohydrolase [Clostridiales bacterium]|jgi:maltooligosyltrehalose trehalohydrolase|nr:maltooligosyltrehalose trehalohydrolase [Clostridiales bacterium]MDN5282139.1 maltooligosyltrehalose trehalohydrolase [Candidatus Ozemobacter sp.]
MEFKIWAPKAKKVVLCLNGHEYEMQPQTKGYWVCAKTNLQEPVLYGFKIDDQGPFPDPKSEFQPDGVHGLSQRWIEKFAWKCEQFDPRPLDEAVIYELHVGTFTDEGTFKAVENKLDHLVDLGVTHLELLPVAAFPGKHGWGYDGVSLYAPHRFYGNPDDLKHLVDTCHSKGLAVILDVVYNHLGPDGNYLGLYAPYFSDRYHTPWGEAVNFDCAHSDEVRRFVIDNALMWLRDFRFDALRIDAVHAIFDFSALHILEELQMEVEKLSSETGRKFDLIAESDLNDPRLLHSRENGGYGLAAQWLDDFHHSLHVMFTGEQQGYYLDFSGPDDLKKCLKSCYVYAGDYAPSRKRRHGRSATGLNYERFVVSLQNHDQIGNRGLGERLCHLIGYDHCQIATALFLLSPFVPMLFQGEEWSATAAFMYFTDHIDEKLAQAVREGRQREFPALEGQIPDPQSENTFNRSKLNWGEISETRHKTMLEWHKKLLKIRKKFLNEIRSGNPDFSVIDSDQRIYRYSTGNILLFANAGNKDHCLDHPQLQKAEILLQNKDIDFAQAGMTLPPGAVILIYQK